MSEDGNIMKPLMPEYCAIQYNLQGNMTECFSNISEEEVLKWANNHTEDTRICVVYRAVLKTNMVRKVEMDEFNRKS